MGAGNGQTILQLDADDNAASRGGHDTPAATSRLDRRGMMRGAAAVGTGMVAGLDGRGAACRCSDFEVRQTREGEHGNGYDLHHKCQRRGIRSVERVDAG